MEKNTSTQTEKIELTSPQTVDEDDWENSLPEPPDGGWGWVIMIASFFNNFILDGIAYAFGVFVSSYLQYFNTSLANVSLCNSLLCGVYLLVGPVVGALVNRFGCRAVGVAGSIIGACAFVLSIFSPNIQTMIFVYGIIGGIGFGMMYLPAVVGVGYYFEKKRSIATGIAVCGTGIGTFCMAPIGKVLLEVYDWKNAHLIIAGLILQGCISSAMMRPLLPKKRIKKFETLSHESPVDTIQPLLSEQNAHNINGKCSDEKQQTTSTPSHTHQSSPLLATNPYKQSRLHSSAYIRSTSGSHHAVSKQDLSRPFNRKDIFFSGSIVNLQEFKSQRTVMSYVASITSIPSVEEHNKRLSCLTYLPKPMADVLAEMLDVTILTNRGMVMLSLGNFVGMLGFYVPIIFTAPRAESLGIGKTEAAFLLSIYGITNTVGRVLSGFISAIPQLSPLLVNNICIIIGGISVLLTPFCTTYETMALAAGSYGLFCSTYISLASVIMCELVGLEKLTNAFGLLCLVRGVTAIAGPPIEGKLYDITGNYDATFYMGGICLILSGILHCMLHLRWVKNQKIK